MKLTRSFYRSALALGLVFALPAASHAAVIYDEIVFKDALGTVLASVTATPAEIAADPDAIYYLTGVPVDPTEYGNFGIVVDSDGNPFELFGISNKAPDGEDLAFGLQAVASQYFPQNSVPDTGAPIDLTTYLDPGLQALGDTAFFISSGLNSAVPEPLTWAMMVVGFAAIGAGLRRKPQLQGALADI